MPGLPKLCSPAKVSDIYLKAGDVVDGPQQQKRGAGGRSSVERDITDAAGCESNRTDQSAKRGRAAPAL
jgi:hypothetical protein